MPSSLRNFALTFLISALIFGILAYAVVGFVFNTMLDSDDVGKIPPTVQTGDVDNPDTDDPTLPQNPDEILGDTFNILLIGSDYQPELFDDYYYEENWTGLGFPDKRNRPWSADMIILLRVDKEHGKFVLCPIPSNARVLVEGENTKLGDIACDKGIELLCGKVSELTGLSMDYYAHVTVGAISSCIDTIGSVQFTIPQDMYYSDPLQNLTIDLQKGTHNITGEKAAQLLRYVGYANADTGRTNTAISFLKAMMKEYLSESHKGGAIMLYSELLKYVETNFTIDDFTNNLDLIFSYSDFEVSTLNYPGATRVYGGVTYFEPSTSAASELFRRLEN